MADEKPVLVIGAGPVGLTMAAELARLGVAVRIVDKATPSAFIKRAARRGLRALANARQSA